MSRILLLGASGQVGGALKRQLDGLHELHAPRSAELDLTGGASLSAYVRRLRPDLIINAAAYTAVDRAEQESERAMAVNARAPELLAREAAALDAALIHYSTDYVYDGAKTSPYTEDDCTSPLSVYGRSKLAGDEAVQAQSGAYLILRTSWVYSFFGHNFLLTMGRLLREREELRVVDDQIGSPTWAEAIAAASVNILAQGGDTPVEFIRRRVGVYHLSCAGQTSWYGFASAIREHMAERESGLAKLIAIPSEEYPTPAARPRYSVLDNGRLRQQFGIELPPWRDALAQAWRSAAGGGSEQQ